MTYRQAEPTTEFQNAVKAAIDSASRWPDDAVQYMSHHVPVYAMTVPTPEQAKAGGCANCTYLGLWASSWPGYPPAPHGTIWLFETGIRSIGGDLRQNTLAVLLHEYDHALQRDHVLDAMAAAKAAGSFTPYRGCGVCPGSR